MDLDYHTLAWDGKMLVSVTGIFFVQSGTTPKIELFENLIIMIIYRVLVLYYKMQLPRWNKYSKSNYTYNS